MILKSLISFTISMLLMPQVQGGDRELIMSSKIGKDQRKTLKQDLKHLVEFNFAKAADSRTLELLNVNDLNSDTAYNWLRARVSSVIEDSDVNKLKISAKASQAYPNNQDPTIETALPAPRQGGSKGVTVMSNIGTALYYAGKTNNQLYTLKVKTGLFSSKKIPLTSPRSGIIQIGEGLFMKKYLMNKIDESAMANSLGRMAVFFHEARHSDGNGKSLGFFHAVCPSGHDFQGSYACDRNLNGPYSIGAQMMKEFIKNCDECSVSEKEQMRLRYLDSINRVLDKTPVVRENVDAEIESLKLQLDTKKMIYQLEVVTGKPTLETYNSIINLEKELLAKANELDAIEFIPSVDWDANSERVRM